MGNYKNMRHSRQEWTKLILFKSFYFLWSFPFMDDQYSFINSAHSFYLSYCSWNIVINCCRIRPLEVLIYCSDEEGVIQNSFMQHEWNATYDCSTNSNCFIYHRWVEYPPCSSSFLNYVIVIIWLLQGSSKSIVQSTMSIISITVWAMRSFLVTNFLKTGQMHKVNTMNPVWCTKNSMCLKEIIT
jgi:hypothetical protein